MDILRQGLKFGADLIMNSQVRTTLKCDNTPHIHPSTKTQELNGLFCRSRYDTQTNKLLYSKVKCDMTAALKGALLIPLATPKLKTHIIYKFLPFLTCEHYFMSFQAPLTPKKVN